MAQMVVAQMTVSHKSTFPAPRFGSCSLAEGIGREQNMPVAAGCGHLWVGPYHPLKSKPGYLTQSNPHKNYSRI